MHNVTLDQYIISVGKSELVPGNGLWVYAFRVRKTTCNLHCIFCTSNYNMWWMLSDKQFLGDLATDDDPSWALLSGPSVLCCVCLWLGGSRCIEDHAVSSGNLFLFVICYIGWFCAVFVSLPHMRFLEYFITSSS